MPGDALQARAIFIDQIKIEVAAVGVGHVGGEDDALAVRMEKRRKVGGAVARHLPLVAAIGLHYENLEALRAQKGSLEQLLIIGLLLGRLRVEGAIGDLLAIGGEKWPSIVAQISGQATQALAVRIHCVDVEVAVAQRSETNLLAVARDSGLGVVAGIVSQAFDARPIGARAVDLKLRKKFPDVTLAIVRRRRAFGARGACRGVDDSLAVRKKVAARGLATPRRDHTLVPAGEIHRVDLGAPPLAHRGLKDELLVVSRKVGFGVLPSEGELPNVAQVPPLLGQQQARVVLGRCCAYMRLRQIYTMDLAG